MFAKVQRFKEKEREQISKLNQMIYCSEYWNMKSLLFISWVDKIRVTSLILLAYVGVINPPHLKCCMKVGKSNKSCLKFLYPDLSTARSPPAGITICWGEVRTEWATCTSNLTSASKIISYINETIFLYWPIGVWCSSKGNKRPNTVKIWPPLLFYNQNVGHHLAIFHSVWPV